MAFHLLQPIELSTFMEQGGGHVRIILKGGGIRNQLLSQRECCRKKYQERAVHIVKTGKKSEQQIKTGML